MKQTIKLGIIVLVVAALATAGIAIAQTDEAEPAPTPGERIAGHLSPLVDDGTITEDQALAVGEYLAENAPRRQGDHHRPRAAVIAFDIVADTIGVDMEALREALGEGQTIAEIAEANGSSGQAVIDALVGALDDRLDEAVGNGRITEEEKAEHLEAATEKITTAVTEGLPQPPQRPRPAVIAFDIVADTIGIEMEALREALGEGQTIAEIAEANGSSGQAVIDALVGALDDRLDEAVENGRITEEEKAEHLATATLKITTAVNEGLPERPHRGHGPGHGHHGPRGGGHGFGGFPGAPAPAPATGTSA